ncbi:hypothetical protein MTO96_017182 [Rhipicephalus appendiculatus]
MVRLVIAAACHIARLVANLGHRWQTLDATGLAPSHLRAPSGASQQPSGRGPSLPETVKSETTAAGATACVSRRAISCCPVCHRDGDSVVVTCFV